MADLCRCRARRAGRAVSSAPANPARDGADVDQARGVGQILFMLYRATEMRTWQVQEARRQFRQLFDDAVEKGPQRVTRNGRGAVIVLSEEEWRRLSEAVPSFGELLASCPIHCEDLCPHRGPRALRQRIFE